MRLLKQHNSHLHANKVHDNRQCNAVVIPRQAVELCIHPLYLMIPAAVSASYAFMIPVATPPNAIAFSYGYLKVYDMVSCC